VENSILPLAGVGIFIPNKFFHRQGRANAALFDSGISGPTQQRAEKAAQGKL